MILNHFFRVFTKVGYDATYINNNVFILKMSYWLITFLGGTEQFDV